MSTPPSDRTLVRFAIILLVVAFALATFVQASDAIGRDTPSMDPLHANHAGGSAPLPLEAARQSEPSPLLGNLGSHHHAITTRSALAQRYFDEGLILTYGFNHAEAIRSYQDALKIDATCAMCYWGIAYALGPNINAPMQDDAVPQAYAALQKAIELAPNASQKERDYIQALSARYAPEPIADRSGLDLAYAEAMQALAQRYPDDLDAATLAAEAYMDLTPWKFWTKDGQPTAYTDKIVALLESVLARNSEHPGANHFYIHAVEASETPERALPSADRLAQLAPGAGHLVHMPAHIYWRVGRYHDAVRINEHAILADENHFTVGGTADRNAHSAYKLSYYPHNIHFLFAAAHSEGQSALALEAARKLVSKIPDEAYRQIPPLEDFRPMPLYALVRFGRWAEILEEPQPPEDLQFSTGIWHWARGMAYLRLGQLDKAEVEQIRLVAISQTDAMKEQDLASFPKAATILEIAANVLGGELAGAHGVTDTQIAKLQAAVEIQDDLPYIEPPAWFFPVRQTLGAALLQAGRAADAEAVYREDLRQYPDNGWSLFGLAESLRAQGKLPEAAQAQAQFEEAWKYADVVITSSRF